MNDCYFVLIVITHIQSTTVVYSQSCRVSKLHPFLLSIRQLKMTQKCELGDAFVAQLTDIHHILAIYGNSRRSRQFAFLLTTPTKHLQALPLSREDLNAMAAIVDYIHIASTVTGNVPGITEPPLATACHPKAA